MSVEIIHGKRRRISKCTKVFSVSSTGGNNETFGWSFKSSTISNQKPHQSLNSWNKLNDDSSGNDAFKM